MTRHRIARGRALPAALFLLCVCARESAAQTSVEGHVGIATPLVTVADKTTTIRHHVTILNPVGFGLKLSPKLTIDFETVVATAVHPGGATGLVVDPGAVYDTGPLAIGLRVAWKINERGNVGVIPLFNRALVHGDGVAWFVEAAFPTFFSAENVEFNAVLHTGVGF